MAKHRADTYRDRKKRRSFCFHHDHHTGESYIRSQLIDLGMRKAFYCMNCARIWFT